MASAAIHCGGTGTTHQTRKARLPSVVLPFSNEQRMNALALKREGACLPLDVAVARPEQLRAAIEIIQRPSYMASTARLRDQVACWDAPRLAAAAVLGLVAHVS